MSMKRHLKSMNTLRISVPTCDEISELNGTSETCMEPEEINETLTEAVELTKIVLQTDLMNTTDIETMEQRTDYVHTIPTNTTLREAVSHNTEYVPPIVINNLRKEKAGHNKECVKRKSEGRLVNIVNDIALSQSLVQLLRDPTVFNFCRLRSKLKSDDRRWMSGFLKLGGLEMLFEGLRSFGRYSGTFSNLVQRLECVMCIRTVMNSQIGMQTITTSMKFGEKFGTGKAIPKSRYSLCNKYNMHVINPRHMNAAMRWNT